MLPAYVSLLSLSLLPCACTSDEFLSNKQPQDAIDLTDNDIQLLGNFPLSPRVRTLLLARNRVAAVAPALPGAVPNLTNLVLASNQLAELADVDVLGRFARLEQLVLMDNPVTKKEVRPPPPVMLVW